MTPQTPGLFPPPPPPFHGVRLPGGPGVYVDSVSVCVVSCQGGWTGDPGVATLGRPYPAAGS
eukprot:3260201-Prorocentrum_lima.AAC.1